MSDLEKIILTSCITIIGGVIVFVIGRIIEKFIIDPIHEQKKTIGFIADNLIYYANVYSNSSVVKPEERDESSKALRKLACELNAKTHAIPFYKPLSSLGIIPKYVNAMDASASLIGMSNTMYHPDNLNSIIKKREKIESYLKIKT